MDYVASNQSEFADAVNCSEPSANIYIKKPFSLGFRVVLPEGKSVSIASGPGGPFQISRAKSFSEDMIDIPINSCLTLSNVILDGGKPQVSSGVLIKNNGKLNILDGAVIRNNNSTASIKNTAGGIHNFGSIFMRGGEISGNEATQTGGGVLNSGSFSMEGGRIENNSALAGDYGGGGVFVNNGGSFSMAGGDIKGNSSKQSRGGGVYISKGSSFQCQGGTISNNAAQNGAGVSLEGAMNMSGGEITGNTAQNMGGGIFSLSPAVPQAEIAKYLNSSVAQTYGQDQSPIGGDGLVDNNSISALTVSGGKISKNSSSVGGGIANFGALDMSGGLVSENTAALRGGGIHNLARAVISGGGIQNNSSEDGAGIYSAVGPGSQMSDLKISGNAKISGNMATGDGGGINIGYNGLQNLKIGPGASFASNKAKAAYYRSPSDDELYKGNVQSSAWTQPFAQGYNNYDISYNNGPSTTQVSFKGKKTTTGKPLEDGMFEYGLYDDKGASWGTAKNDANGDIAFPEIDASASGISKFNMKEISTPGEGWELDKTSYPCEAAIKTQNGVPFASASYPSGLPAFSGAYTPPGCSIAFSGMLSGGKKSLKGGDFNFGVFDRDGKCVSNGANDSSGKINFEPFKEYTEGLYQYTVRETTKSGNGWDVDTSQWPVEASVSDDGDGNMSASLNFPQGKPSFKNSYSASPAQVKIAASAAVKGASLNDGQFEYTLYDENNNKIANAFNNKNGDVQFPAVLFSEPGQYNYSMRELAKPLNGWENDTSSHPVQIDVKDNGEGMLVGSYKRQVFANSYSASPASVLLNAKMSLRGAKLSKGMFNFAVYDQDGREVALATNDKDGNVIFPLLSFQAPGEYLYAIKPVLNRDDCYHALSKRILARINVSDDSNGHLTASVTYPYGYHAFEFAYRSPQRSKARK